jgi:hypothetical protein
MFDVSRKDGRLPNKAEVLVVRSIPASDAAADVIEAPPVAVSTKRLDDEPVLHLAVDGTNLVVVTSVDGANRVYASGEYRFVGTDGDLLVQDAAGRDWVVSEADLEATFDANLRLPRVSAHRAFWFGW